ncbi:DNA topoisomerase I [Methanohalobium evestigatum Z-7303]|uniref:DNA topoisomerase 1 n=1 Tax=Methanohalobium evestigatum (strain ATCC BAA-1072 / DSM 3721 / NBRC 107634 / OCM 161 / Z-7303) TaxID=644295 RepID=D7E6X7_METEZ|nr:DNA topoisomerase I [Methanohalobium evestigatum]ADI73601.1 DNA topoisomerase I [Methanohalobium evestigatum Z-7303]
MHLIIAEKHIAAKRIAAILAPKKPKKVRVSGVDTYEYEDNEDDKIVMGLSGHIVELDFPKEYNNWQKVNAEDLIDAELITKPTQVKIVAALKKLGKKASKVTIATDYDGEGELIGVEALDIIKKVNQDIQFDRVKYSAITEKEIKNAFSNPVNVDFNLADAGHSRQVIDLVWGASLTRYISLSAGRLGKMFLSVGRVQSPTLALIVDREKEREAFVPDPYWEVYATLANSNGEEFVTQHKTQRFWDKNQVNSVVDKLKDCKTAEVTSVEKSTKQDKPPSPFNTTEFISAANSVGFTASNAMRIAETLYTNGYISYPRTDNTVYPDSLDLRNLIAMFKSGQFKQYAQYLLNKSNLVPTRGKKETQDHPPIYPTSAAKKSELNEDEWKIYEMVVRRFFATFADPAKWETMKVKFDIGSEEFRAKGARLISPGWRWFYPYNSPEDKILPPLKKGEVLTVKSSKVADKETQPPGRYGQGRLVRIMEELGLGTKATRHEIISKLFSRAYVHSNPLQPTKTAFAVIDALENYAPTITKHEMTSKLEEDMEKISEGKIKEDEVLKESRDMLKSMFSELESNRDNITQSLRNGLREDKVIGTCPECESRLMVRRSKRGSRFIGCDGYPDCTFSLPLPKSGQIIVTDKVCEDHGINHIRVNIPGKRPWNLGCPHCNFIEWQKEQENNKNKQKDTTPKSITEINGIGKVTAEKLENAGVSSVEELANADAVELSKQTNLSVKKIKNWQEYVA